MLPDMDNDMGVRQTKQEVLAKLRRQYICALRATLLSPQFHRFTVRAGIHPHQPREPAPQVVEHEHQFGRQFSHYRTPAQ